MDYSAKRKKIKHSENRKEKKKEGRNDRKEGRRNGRKMKGTEGESGTERREGQMEERRKEEGN